KSEDRRQNTADGNKNRVDEDLAPGRGFSNNIRHHGHSSAFIVSRLEQCERPEMRRRPEEDDQEEHDALQRHRTARCRPTYNRWQCTCGASDDDVLGRRALEPDRIYDTIEENGE